MMRRSMPTVREVEGQESRPGAAVLPDKARASAISQGHLDIIYGYQNISIYISQTQKETTNQTTSSTRLV